MDHNDQSRDFLNNEIVSSNPYSIDLSIWKSDKPIYSIRTLNKTLSDNVKPKWKIFENNYDTSIDKKLLDNNNRTLRSNDGLKNFTIIKTNLTNYWISLFDKKKENQKIDSKTGWSNWSNYSECFSQCLISKNELVPVGFQISTRKCYSLSNQNYHSNKKCPGSRIRLKLCDAQHICEQSNRPIRSVNQYVNAICDNNQNGNESIGMRKFLYKIL